MSTQYFLLNSRMLLLSTFYYKLYKTADQYFSILHDRLKEKYGIFVLKRNFWIYYDCAVRVIRQISHIYSMRKIYAHRDGTTAWRSIKCISRNKIHYHFILQFPILQRLQQNNDIVASLIYAPTIASSLFMQFWYIN